MVAVQGRLSVVTLRPRLSTPYSPTLGWQCRFEARRGRYRPKRIGGVEALLECDDTPGWNGRLVKTVSSAFWKRLTWRCSAPAEGIREADHGSPDMPHDIHNEIAFFAIGTPPCFMPKLEGTGCRGHRPNPQEKPLWASTFAIVEQPRLELFDFVAWYNTYWLATRQGARTPVQVWAGQRLAAGLTG